ncbi:MAG: 3-isopropylmalate dehydratase large subunit [Gemmatimonadota bacterium]
MPATLLDRLWDAHSVERFDDGSALLYVDRLLLYELTAPPAFAGLRRRGLPVRNPHAALAVADHSVSTLADRTIDSVSSMGQHLRALARDASAAGIAHLGIDDPRQGIVHVVAPESGWVLPGISVVCGDSHTCTLGALGALAIGVGSSDLEQALATQTVRLKKPAAMRIAIDGCRAPGVFAKDVALHLLHALGTRAGEGAAIEYAGAAVAEFSVEERLTLCNLTAELGSRIGLVAPDATTLRYVAARPLAPPDGELAAAAAQWLELRSDADAEFARDVAIDAGAIAPRITWGTTPAQSIAIDGHLPRLADATPDLLAQWRAAYEYMALREGGRLLGERIDVVFIGSCTNSRLSDLQAAARVVRGRRVAKHVRALVVPGSEAVRRAAEAEGLDEVFRAAGFEWRRAGCSMCVAANDDRVGAGERCVSTSNRNFPNRQGRAARTHLASPATAAACSIAGEVADVREFLR